MKSSNLRVDLEIFFESGRYKDLKTLKITSSSQCTINDGLSSQMVYHHYNYKCTTKTKQNRQHEIQNKMIIFICGMLFILLSFVKFYNSSQSKNKCIKPANLEEKMISVTI